MTGEEEQGERVVEYTARYETVVNNIDEAFAFIVTHFEKVGPDPSVHIHPASEGPPPMLAAIMGQPVEAAKRRFHVAVEGSQTQKVKKGAPL